MKILHVYKSYYPETIGGVERSIKNLCDGLNKLNVHTSILTTSKKTIKKKFLIKFRKNFEISNTPFSLEFILNLKSISNNFDIIHYHFPWPFMDISHFLAGIKKPTVLTYHSDIVHQKFLKIIYYPVMKMFLNSMDTIVTSSLNYKNSSNILQKYFDKTKVIPFGISKKDYKINLNLISKYKKKYGKNFILFVGVLRYYKGINFLVDAVRSTNYKLIIVGNGSLYNEIYKQIKNKKLNNVKIYRKVPDKDLPYLIKLSKCIVLPSNLRSEAFGFSLLEGLMFEKPLISCEIRTGTSFINRNRKTGYVVKASSSKSLRTAIDKIFSKKLTIKNLKLNSRKRFNRYFNQNLMAKSYYKLYKSILNNKNNI